MYELEDLHNTHYSQMTDPFDDNFDMIESGRSSGGNSGYKPVNMPSGSWNTGSKNVYGAGSGSHYNVILTTIGKVSRNLVWTLLHR